MNDLWYCIVFCRINTLSKRLDDLFLKPQWTNAHKGRYKWPIQSKIDKIYTALLRFDLIFNQSSKYNVNTVLAREFHK